MTDHDHDLDASTLARRHLIRGGAVLAGAAGLTAVGAALAPKASATDGAAILQGTTNVGAGAATTGIRITSTTSVTPSLTLSHGNQDAPQLALTPRPVFDDSSLLPELKAGELLNTDLGPYIGLSDGATTPTVVTGYLATNFDLDNKADATPVRPKRVLNTSLASGRLSIKGQSSASAFDSSYRLRKGAWIDVAVAADSGDGVVDGAFLNLTGSAAIGVGALEIYPPGNRSATPSVWVSNANPVSNASFTQVLLSSGFYLVRIFTTQTMHVLLDVTGYAMRGPSAEPVTSATNARRRAGFAARRVVKSTRKR